MNGPQLRPLTQAEIDATFAGYSIAQCEEICAYYTSQGDRFSGQCYQNYDDWWCVYDGGNGGPFAVYRRTGECTYDTYMS